MESTSRGRAGVCLVTKANTTITCSGKPVRATPDGCAAWSAILLSRCSCQTGVHQHTKVRSGIGQGPTYQLLGVTGLADQFSQMNMGHKGLHLVTTNLLTAPPELLGLHQLPPDIILPPNSSLSNSPFANADPSYQTSGACSMQSLPPIRYSISPRFPLAS